MTDEYEQHAGEARVPAAVMVMLVGGVALVGAAIAAPYVLPPLDRTLLLAAGAALGALFWLIGLFAVMGGAPRMWKVVSLVVLVGAGALAGMQTMRVNHANDTHDASTFAEMEMGNDGVAELPRNADRGPVSHRFIAAQAEAKEDRERYDAALAAFNLPALNSPYLLEASPETLQRCGEIAELKTLAEENAAKAAERQASLAEAIDESQLAPPIKQGTRMMIAPRAGGDTPDPTLAPQLALLDSTGELCRLLAKRSWRNEAAYFVFPNAADDRQFKAINARRAAAAAEIETAKRAEKERFAEGREMVRAALE